MQQWGRTNYTHQLELKLEPINPSPTFVIFIKNPRGHGLEALQPVRAKKWCP
jgi:hypothetical protein